MSVAFRRESDEEHLEPRPELPVPPGPNLVTPTGLAQIAARADTLEGELQAALDAGAAEDAVKELRRQLRYWHARRATAQVAPAADGDQVAFGTRVTWVRAGAKPQTVALVGHDEADPATGRIAFTAPLARALMGGFKGDIVVFAGGEIEIVKIVPLEQPI